MSANNDIKLLAAGAGVKLWQIAKELNVRDDSFSRKLRKELSDDEKQRIFNIINELKEQGE